MVSCKQAWCLVVALASVRAAMAEDRAVTASSAEMLARTLAQVDFKRAPLEDVLEELGHQADVNIVVDWPALRAAKIAGDVPITIALRKVCLSTALSAVLEQAARPDANLDYDVRGGVVNISTRTAFVQPIEVRAYDCRRLCTIEFDAQQKQALEQAVARLWKQHFAVFAPPWRGLPPYKPPVGPKREADDILTELRDGLGGRRLRELADAIRNTVDPQSWRSQGGQTGGISIVGHTLVVRQNARNHDAIARLLDQLRDSARADPNRRE